MVSAINNSNAMHITGPQKSAKVPVANSEEPGKAKMDLPPGQVAKTKIENSGRTDLPANIQGKVASALARGLNVDGLLKLQEVTSPDVVDETTEDETTPDDIEVVADASSEPAPSIAQPDVSPSIATVPADNDATIAADLLENAEPDADDVTA